MMKLKLVAEVEEDSYFLSFFEMISM